MKVYIINQLFITASIRGYKMSRQKPVLDVQL